MRARVGGAFLAAPKPWAWSATLRASANDKVCVPVGVVRAMT
jgi:hypothetical protein